MKRITFFLALLLAFATSDGFAQHHGGGMIDFFYYLLVGYVAVKIISALDAGYSAERYNQNLSLGYNAQTNSAMFSLNIPLK